ncbi:hypothetical protein K0M31_002492, partial [Melipona bicolor]
STSDHQIVHRLSIVGGSMTTFHDGTPCERGERGRQGEGNYEASARIPRAPKAPAAHFRLPRSPVLAVLIYALTEDAIERETERENRLVRGGMFLPSDRTLRRRNLRSERAKRARERHARRNETALGLVSRLMDLKIGISSAVTTA